MDTSAFDNEDPHRYSSVHCFNQAWELIDKKNATANDNEAMLLLSMCSAWHWSQHKDCKPQNLSIAYWQISRIYALCGRVKETIRDGELSLNYSRRKDIDMFAVGYAYEALARAQVIAANKNRMKSWLAKAKQVAKDMQDKETRKMLLDDLPAERPSNLDLIRPNKPLHGRILVISSISAPRCLAISSGCRVSFTA